MLFLPPSIRAFCPALLLVGTFISSPATASVGLLTDEARSVDQVGWNLNVLTGRGFFTATERGGLIPQFGPEYFIHWNNNDFNPVFKDLEVDDLTEEGLSALGGSNAYVPGTYTLTVVVGNPDFRDYPEFPLEDINPYLTVENDDSHSWRHRISHGYAKKLEKPVPEIGQWTAWTLVFEIDEATSTNEGAPVLGQSIGVALVGRAGDDGGYAFDSVSLTFTPDGG